MSSGEVGTGTIKVAVIGAGAWGVNLVRNFAALGVLKSVCDDRETQLATIGAKYPVKLTRSYTDVLTDPEVRGVVVATPAETHFRIAREALLAKKDVFVEKPLSLHSSEAEELVRLAEQSRQILMVGHLLRYHPAVLKLKELVDSGALGKLEYLYSNRLNLGKVRREENALWSFAPHDIAVILSLLNDQLPIQVSATGGTYLQPNIADLTISHLLFDGGVRGHIFVSWLHPYKEQRLVLIGSAAMAAFDDTADGPKLHVFSKDIELKNGQFVVQKPVGTAVEYEATEPLRAECQHFLDCIHTRSAPRTDGREGLRVLTVLEACHRSLQLNGEPQLVRERALETVSHG